MNKLKSSLVIYFAISMALLLPLIGILESSCSAPTPSLVIGANKLVASDGVNGDKFGVSVSMDSDTAVVGAFNKDSLKGAAYVFVCSGDAWSQQAELTAPDAVAGDEFGVSVSISGDTVAVGAYIKNTSEGAVYIYVRSGDTWSQQAELTAPDASSGAELGASVCLSGDTLVAGAAGSNGFTGAVYVFVRSGDNWSQQAKLVVADATNGAFFGFPVSIDGDTIVAGASGENNYTGAAYVFTRSGSIWSQQAKLTASDAAASDNFGSAVSVSGDTIVVGSPQKNNYTGAVYVYTRSGDSWSQQAKLSASDASKGDEFGASFCADGSTIAVGACNKDSAKGAVYVFVESANKWTLQNKITASDATDGAAFGMSLSMYEGTMVIGAPSADAGGVYICDNFLTTT